VPGGAADRHGLRTRDVLLNAAGKQLGNNPGAVLSALLENCEAIAFEIERGGKRQTVTMKPDPR
jgi:S1-C subfamily serine protease